MTKPMTNQLIDAVGVNHARRLKGKCKNGLLFAVQRQPTQEVFWGRSMDELL
jgi:hypothetical protein